MERLADDCGSPAWPSWTSLIPTRAVVCRTSAAVARDGRRLFQDDFGERIPTDVVYHDGSDPVKMHNHLPDSLHETVFNLLEEVRGKGDAVVFAPSSYASGQRLPVHWAATAIRHSSQWRKVCAVGSSLGLCGFGFWSHESADRGLPDPAVYKRWVAFGLLSSHSRLHGSTSYRVAVEL